MFQMHLRPSSFFPRVHISNPYRATFLIKLFTSFSSLSKLGLFEESSCFLFWNITLPCAMSSLFLFISFPPPPSSHPRWTIFREHTAYCSGYKRKVHSQHDGRFLLECLCHRHGRKEHAVSHIQSTVVTISSLLHTVVSINETRSWLRHNLWLRQFYCSHQPCYEHYVDKTHRLFPGTI